MKIMIIETQEFKSLVIRDSRGTEWTKDFCSTLSSWSDFTPTPDGEAYLCTADAFEYWEIAIQARQAFESAKEEAIKQYGQEAVEEALEGIGNCDMEEIPSHGMACLKALES